MADDGQTTIDTLFQETPAAPVATEAVPDQVVEQVIDPNQAAVTPAPVVPQEQQAPQQVPLATLIETRRRAQAAEDEARQARMQALQLTEALQRLTQPQQPAQPQIDPNLDPAAAIQDLERRVAANLNAIDQKYQRQALNERLNLSESRAQEKHGADLVAKAFEAARESGFAPSFVNRSDPYGEMVAWYQGNQVRQEVGGDLNAYRAKVEAEVRAKIIAEMKGGAQVPRNLPPSLSTATSAASSMQVVPDEKDFFKSMFSKPQRT
jgi:hypothetical protein